MSNEYSYTNKPLDLTKPVKAVDLIETMTNLNQQRTLKNLPTVGWNISVPLKDEEIIPEHLESLCRATFDIVSYDNHPLVSVKETAFNSTGGASIIGDTFSKATGNKDWDAQVYSVYGFAEACRAEARGVDTTLNVMFGLNRDPSSDASYASIDYAIYLNSDGNLHKYENGVGINLNSSYMIGDILAVEYDGAQTIQYKKNGKVLGTSTFTQTEPKAKLYFDSSFYQVGSSLEKVAFYKSTSVSSLSANILAEHYQKVRQVADDSANGARCVGCATECAQTCSYNCYTDCAASCTSNCSFSCGSACSSGCATACAGGCAGACSGGNCGSNCSGSTCGSSCTTSCGGVCTTACGSSCGNCTSQCSSGCGINSCTSTCAGNCSASCNPACTGSDGCGDNCTGKCRGCIGPCVSTCKNSCANGCEGSCSGYCMSCSSYCNSACGNAGTCGNICTGTCGSACAGTCGTSCAIACGNACSGATCGANCTHTCGSGCSHTCGSVCVTTCGAFCSGASCGSNCTLNCYSNCGSNCGMQCHTTCTASCYQSCSSSCSSGCSNSQRIGSDARTL